MILLVAILLGYLIGSIPFTQVVAKLVKGIDLRTVGSKNVGGRNLTRQLGLGWGLLGGALDVAKGAASLWLATAIGAPYPASLLAGVAAVAGHNWPIWLGFHGGKGLATALGTIAWLALPQAAMAFVLCVFVLLLTRNILLTSAAGFAFLLAIFSYYAVPSEILYFTLGVLVVVLIASFPDIAHKLRTAGGVRKYFQDPDSVYPDENSKAKP
jgi:glycerol-3-phosphate acyltransferase PlsY